MSENFNPYAEWLGLQAVVTAPNHYQLLGIDESVGDPAAIASAADRAMTRVRACKPGPHAAAWAQLLDRISAAKAELMDPNQRRSYTEQLSKQRSPAAAPVLPNQLPPSPPSCDPLIAAQPAAAALDPMAPMAPFGAVPQPTALQPNAPQPNAPQLPQAAQAAIPTAVPYLQPAAPTVAPPNPMAPVSQAGTTAPVTPAIPQAAMVPLAQGDPNIAFAQALPIAPSPMAPMQPAAVPVATAVPTQAVLRGVASPPAAAGATLVPQPAAASPPPTFDGAPKLKGKPTVKARARAKSGGLLGPILLGGSVGGLILVVVGVVFYLANSQPTQSSPPIAAVNSTPPVADRGGTASTIPRRLDEMPESERPRPTVFTPPVATSPTPERPPQSMTEPEVAMTPTSVTPPPTAPVPEPAPAPGPSRDDLQALAQSLTTARAAIGELNFAIADREISKADALAKLEEHQAKIGRLKLLRDYVSRFQAAIGETLGRVNAGDQIELGGGKSFGIVEKTADLLIIRVNGRNQRYPMSELPAGLATRLAEMSLDKTSPDTFAMKAAYVGVNPRIDDDVRKTADVWWNEAASVSDVPDLRKAIDDDYSLKQDVMAVPLLPSATAELTAHAERLKDARKIEEFAKEFQGAIDESLKTVEPEMELSIGGSTIVTIKELKADRVMLTVAGETRGFQFTKLPLGLAASIAERILPRDAPLTMVMKGAYYAAREKDQSNKQFRPLVLDWWKQAGETDQQLQAVIQDLVKQYPE